MADMSMAPDWFAAWVADVQARGGVPTRMPSNTVTEFGFDTAGELAERFPSQGGGYAYSLAPLTVRLHDKFDRSVADLYGATLGSFWVGYDEGQAIGDGITDSVTGAVTSATKQAVSLVPLLAWVALGVVAYGALVQAGILPPVRELLASGRSRAAQS